MGDPERPRKERGALAIVLHTHMPYVEGFGTWPFGEEWLWEAMAGCYLPLLELLDQREPAITLSVTPVLLDQLSAPGMGERFERFIAETRKYTHEEDAQGLRKGGHGGLAAELERAWREDYERAAERMADRGGDVVGAMARHASWTSTATHAVLPLAATDAGARLQIESGIAAHRAYFEGQGQRMDRAGWRGGMWLPECGYAPHIEPLLARAGVRRTCVERTGEVAAGDAAHLRPIVGRAGLVLYPIDRRTIELVWSDRGYPADGVYRDYHRHTVHHHNPWRNDGEAYDHQAALTCVRAHACNFVSRVRERLRGEGEGLPGGGLAVCALDTELLGHWWYEGVQWLGEVIEECARQGVEMVRLDEADERFEPVPVSGFASGAAPGSPSGLASESRPAPGLAPGPASVPAVGSALDEWSCTREMGVSTWGKDNDLSTWSGPAVAEMCVRVRRAELEVVRAACEGTAGEAAVRELLALQASDWPFMVSRGLAVPYAKERFEGHADAFAKALAAGPGASTEGLRKLAGHSGSCPLRAP